MPHPQSGNYGFRGDYAAVRDWHKFLLDQFAIESSGPIKTIDDPASKGGVAEHLYVCYAFIDSDINKTIVADFWDAGQWDKRLKAFFVTKGN